MGRLLNDPKAQWRQIKILQITKWKKLNIFLNELFLELMLLHAHGILD